MDKEIIEYVSINNDNIISLGTNKGFAIVDISELKCRINRRHFEKGIGIVSPYCIDGKLTNLLCFVGKGNYPHTKENFVLMWDDENCKLLAKSEFKTNVVNHKIENKKLFVSDKDVLYVHNFPSMENLYSLDCRNGIFDVKKTTDRELLVYSKNEKYRNVVGIIQITNNNNDHHHREKKYFEEIKYDIGTIKINNQGTMFVVACGVGKKILLYEITEKGPVMKQKWYRGKNTTKITSMSFNEDSSLLAITSTTGTIHIFDVFNPEKNTKSSIPLGWMVSDYFSCVWSRFKIYVNSYTESESIGCYFSQNDFFVICTDGIILRFRLDVKDNEYRLIDQKNILGYIDSQFHKYNN